MSNELPLATLIDLASGELDEAQRALGHAQKVATEAETQTNALISYRDEYRTRLTTSAQSGLSGANWRNFQTFIETLDAAVEQQRRVMVSAQRKLEVARNHWMEKRRKLTSYEALAERARLREQAVLARREQRESDEYAAKIVRMRRDSTHD
ncbi:flagella biosynthesis chaperone FliJ [Pararobbsia silviterrae]|uniref:Flagellar FliJ protein n=1 Tax=Pararobbsia silviterrae TaxID=1792498 RepID=A0A494X3W4_9BURK|nr:flagella biosynthesis chaperone FliJ [Pararobbsia silviterrae]